MKNTIFFNTIKLHFIVVIFGFTAILGKLIHLPAPQLVWYRMLIATVSFLVYFAIKKRNFKISPYQVLKIIGVGLIVTAHWITFFGAVKLSNVSVTLGCLASTTLFTSFLEPLFFRKKVNKTEVIIGVLIISGLYLIFQFQAEYWEGIICATSSAFLAGLFTVLNRKLVAKHPASVISFWEMLGGLIGITIFLFFSDGFNSAIIHPTTSDLFYLLILGVICTAFAFVIQVDVMKQLTAYVVALTINLEPVYGIILAFLFFGDSELMSYGFYAGTLIIIIAVFGYPVYQRLMKK